MNANVTDIPAPGSKSGAARPDYVLLIGYGNTLRSDDGAGPVVAERVAEQGAVTERCHCLTVHQLSPELALDLCMFDRVIFVDASTTVAPGKVKIKRVDSSQGRLGRSFHSSSQEAILAMSQALYGRAPCAWSVAIGAQDFSVGEQLSAPVARCVDRLVRHLSYRTKRWSENGFPDMHQHDMNLHLMDRSQPCA